jgi:hypothetical protein
VAIVQGGGIVVFFQRPKISSTALSQQSGVGAFLFSRSIIDTICKFISNQKKHHTMKTFRGECPERPEKFEIS